MSTIVDKEPTPTATGRKRVKVNGSRAGVVRPAWETQRKALQSAVAEQVRRNEKEQKLKDKYMKKKNPVAQGADQGNQRYNYFNSGMDSAKPTNQNVF